MEQATRLVYDGGRILSRAPGRMLTDSAGYLARGSDSVLFFQWRASRAGAEMYHSAMVPHAGPDSAAFREVVALGGAVRRLAEVAGGDGHRAGRGAAGRRLVVGAGGPRAARRGHQLPGRGAPRARHAVAGRDRL